MPKKFIGIIAPLTTPFENDRIAPDRLIANIKRGSVYLSDEESEALVIAAKQNASPEKKIIAGTARESTILTIDFTNRMADLGVDAALIRTPSYFKSRLDNEALKYHFLSIADKTRIPIIVYNIPVHTGISLSPQLVIELSKHPHITGVKDSSGNLSLLGETKPFLHEGFHFLLGAASVLLPGLIMGADGGIITVSTIAPDLSTKLYDLYKENQLQEAVQTQLSLIPLNKALIQTYGVPAAKYALDLLGFYGGLPRGPLQPLGEAGKQDVRKILKNLGLIN